MKCQMDCQKHSVVSIVNTSLLHVCSSFDIAYKGSMYAQIEWIVCETKTNSVSYIVNYPY